MSRGLGKFQIEVLDTLRSEGKWMWSMDLTFLAFLPHRKFENETIPHSFYVSVRKAASGLVKRGLLKAGTPAMDDKMPYGQGWRAAYWLPDQKPPPGMSEPKVSTGPLKARRENKAMDILTAIADAQSDGFVMVLAADGVKAFADVDRCEEHIAGVTGRFAVVRLLWTGGTDKPEESPSEDYEARRREINQMVRQAFNQAVIDYASPKPAPEKPE